MYVQLDNGSEIRTSTKEFSTSNSIPKGNWLVKIDQQTGEYYLKKQEDFKLPSKVYGDLDGQVNRYLNTFKHRDKNLGILLNGLKGTGKSLTAKKLCIESGLPVLIITGAYSGAEFESFISSIKQECIIFIDEFEKVYRSGGGRNEVGDSQSTLLTILDGVFESKKLFLLTSNFSDKVNDALMNRPSRIHYFKNYEGLSSDVINDVIDDLLDNPKEKDRLLQVLDVIGVVNMDVLVSLILEMNLYKEDASSSLKMLNIKPSNSIYSVEWTALQVRRSNMGTENEHKRYPSKFTATINHHPLSNQQYVDLYGYPSDLDEYYTYEVELDFNKTTKVLKSEKGIIEIEHEGTVYKFTKKEPFKFQYNF